jgi:hypothetical protein
VLSGTMSNGTIIDCSGSNANTTECVQQAQFAADKAFAASLAINAGLFLFIMIAFMIIRKRFTWCYEPMCNEAVFDALAIRPPKPGVFGWFASLYGVSDREIALKRGLDAVLFIKTCRYLFFIVVGYCFYTFAVLAPIQ